MAQAAAVAAVVKDQKKSAAERCPSCASYPLKRSYFSAKFLATPPNTIFSIYVAEGVKLVDWPVEEMHEFLGTQRQWGQYILRDDKLCRQIVAVFYNAYEQAAGMRPIAARARLSCEVECSVFLASVLERRAAQARPG